MQLIAQINDLDSLNDNMQSELNEVRLWQPENELDQVEELRRHYTRSVDGLKARLAQLEATESKLLSSQAEVRHLQQQLMIYRQDTCFMEGVQDKLLSYETLQHQVQLLREENVSLSRDRTNTDLLRYQTQTLQHRCAELEGKVMKLRVQNSELKLSQGKEKEASPSVLQAQLAELQQREIVSLKEYGELTTQ